MAKETTQKQKLTHAQRAYLARIKNLVSSSSSFQSLLLQVRQQGKNYVRQTERLESKRFDEKFVDELEKGFNAIDTIIANPRTFIKEEPELVEAGLAKKINAQSITHLASHTQFVHSVDEKGNVTPEKILTIHAEIDVQIYENRFVMTLIKKCSLFIEKRFNFIKDHGETFDSDLLLLKSTSNIDGAKYEIDSRIKVSTESKDNGNKEKNADILKRLAVLRERCAYYLRSPFAADMYGAKDVANPIHMTNMIVKNPYYHAAYELWRFIDQYTDLGITYDIKETEQEFSQPYFEELMALVLADILTLRSNRVKDRKIDTSKVKERVVNPKVLFTLEDETYYDGKFLYDQFPAYKKNRPNPMALTPEEAKEQRLAIEDNLREERYKKTLVDEAIEEQKSKDVAKEAIERQKKLEAEEKERLKREKAEAKRLAKEAAEAEKKRKLEEKLALQKEQEELEKARKAVKRTARKDRKGIVDEEKPSVEEKPIEPIIEEEKPVEEQPIVEEAPVEEVAPAPEPVVEEQPAEPIVEEPAPEPTPEPEPVAEEPAPVEEKPKKPRKPRKKRAPKKKPVEPTSEPIKEEQPIELEPAPEPEPEPEPIKEEQPVEQEPTPVEEQPAEPKPKKPRKKRTPRKKKPVEPIPEPTPEPTPEPEPVVEEPAPVEEKPKKPRKKRAPRKKKPVEPAPVVEEPAPEPEPQPEPEPIPEEPKKDSKSKQDKFVRNVPTFRAEKNYVFIKTRKSQKAKKVILKGKLK